MMRMEYMQKKKGIISQINPITDTNRIYFSLKRESMARCKRNKPILKFGQYIQKKQKDLQQIILMTWNNVSDYKNQKKIERDPRDFKPIRTNNAQQSIYSKIKTAIRSYTPREHLKPMIKVRQSIQNTYK